jgi:hypothetical protein
MSAAPDDTARKTPDIEGNGRSELAGAGAVD